MTRFVLALTLTALTAPAFASNARADRAAASVQQYTYRQQCYNQQWAQHFRVQQQDMRNYYERDIHAEPSRYGNMVRRNELNRYRWVNHSPRTYTDLSLPQSFGNRRR